MVYRKIKCEKNGIIEKGCFFITASGQILKRNSQAWLPEKAWTDHDANFYIYVDANYYRPAYSNGTGKMIKDGSVKSIV